eukprot:1829511-Pyramimonas_sp.AAC.1
MESDLEQLEKDHKSHVPFGSFCASASAGGLLFFISRALLAQFETVHLVQVVPCRIAYLNLFGPKGCCQIFNVHVVPD